MSTLKTNNIQHVDRSDPSIIINTDGSVNIAGTMTYEDVTNVDAVGIITGRSNIDAQKQVHVGTGVSVKAGGLNVTAGITTVQALQATTGTFSAAVSGTTGAFTDDVTVTGDKLKVFNASAPQLRINSDTGDGASTRLTIGRATASNNFVNGSAAGDSAITFPSNLAFGVGTAEKVRITAAGNFGVATQSPAQKLHVYGNSGTTAIAVGDNSTTEPYMLLEANETDNLCTVHSRTNNPLNFKVNNSEKMRITSGGNLLMGTTTAAISGGIGILIANSAGARIKLCDSDLGVTASDGFELISSDNGTAYVWNRENTPILFGTNNTERLRIASGGNVEIGSAAGTGADFSLLDGLVINTVNGSAGLIINSSSSSHNAYLAFGYGSGSGTSHNDQFSAYIGRVGDNVLTFGTNNSIRGAFDGSGNFSVGTVSAVNNSGYGGITLNGTSGSILSFKDSDVEKSRIAVVADNTLSIQAPPGGSGLFRIDQLTADGSGNITGAAERLRIVSGGRMFLGCTGAININGVTTGHTFQQVDDYKWILGLRCELTNKVGLAIRYAAGGNDHDVFIFEKDSTVKFVIHNTGNVANANNSYGQTSDVSLKENIVDANSQWNDIKNVKVRNFNFKAETGLPNHTQIGVVAQEIETTSPKLVTENEEGIKEVGYSVLYMKAIKALQEAMARIETLEAKVVSLESAIRN